MIRVYAILAVVLAALGGGATWWVMDLRVDLADTKAALALCVEYKETSDALRDAINNLPDDADAVLERLREAAERGQGRSDP